MKKKILFKAVGKVAKDYGDKWGKIAGDKAVTWLSEKVRQRGLTDRTYNLESLTEELKTMYRQGRFNRQEWEEIQKKLKEAWRKKRENR